MQIELTTRTLYLVSFGREVTIRPHDGYCLDGYPAPKWGTVRHPCGTVERWALGWQWVSGPVEVVERSGAVL